MPVYIFSFSLLYSCMSGCKVKQVAWKARTCFFLLKPPKLTPYESTSALALSTDPPPQPLAAELLLFIFFRGGGERTLGLCDRNPNPCRFDSPGEICGFKIHGQNVPFDAVVVDKSTGEGVIRSTEKLDCELQKDYTFTIQAYDCGNGPDGANVKKSHK